MSKPTKNSLAAPRAGTLRRKAERRARDGKTRPAESAPEQDVVALLHELEVHQIDLEMQNEELRLSEERQKAILGTIPDPAWLKDREGRFLAVNPAWCRFHGLDAQEAAGKTVFDVFARDVAERLTQQDAAVVASGAPLRVEEALHDRDGCPIWFETIKTSVSNLDGRVIGTAGIARDVTAHKQSQEALRQANHHLRIYQRLVERSPNAFVVLDREKVYRMVNAAFLRRRRKKAEEVIGHTAEEVLGAGEFERVRPHLEQALAGKEVRFSDWFVYLGLGPRFIMIAYYPLLDKRGKTEFIVVKFRDATRRKAAEDSLHQSEARYRSIFDNSPIALWEHDCSEVKRYIDELRRSGVTDFRAYFQEHRQAVVDCVARIRPLDVNHAAVTLHGAHSKEELLAGFPRLFQEESYEAFLSALLAIADGKTSLDCDCAARTLRGETIYESIRSAAAPGCEQTLARVFLSAVDISERKHAEDSVKKWVDAQTAELAATNQQLQREVTERRQAEEKLHKRQAELAHLSRVKTMGEMANGLAHELNQPLAAILMRAEVAAKKLRTRKAMPQEELLAVLDFIADETHRGGEIIRRIRQFVRKTEPETIAVEPAEVVREVLPLVEKDLQDAGIALAVSVCPALPKILADKIQIQQVLLNLVRNAAEAMVNTSQDVRVLGVSVEPRDKVVAISVSDAGCGISEDRIAALFGSFSSTKPGGMGVGLMISRSIVEAHKGAIWAARNPERGMTFTFTLPIAAEDQ